MALAFGGIDRGEEDGREHTLKNESVATKRVFDQMPSSRLNRSLRPAFSSGKNGARKAGEDGLFGHTFKPYPNRLFVLFYQRKFNEISLKFVPFLPDILFSRDGLNVR